MSVFTDSSAEDAGRSIVLLFQSSYKCYMDTHLASTERPHPPGVGVVSPLSSVSDTGAAVQRKGVLLSVTAADMLMAV